MNAGLRAVFLMKRPTGSPVKPKRWLVGVLFEELVDRMHTFTREPTIVHGHFEIWDGPAISDSGGGRWSRDEILKLLTISSLTSF